MDLGLAVPSALASIFLLSDLWPVPYDSLPLSGSFIKVIINTPAVSRAAVQTPLGSAAKTAHVNNLVIASEPAALG